MLIFGVYWFSAKSIHPRDLHLQGTLRDVSHQSLYGLSPKALITNWKMHLNYPNFN